MHVVLHFFFGPEQSHQPIEQQRPQIITPQVSDQIYSCQRRAQILQSGNFGQDRACSAIATLAGGFIYNFKANYSIQNQKESSATVNCAFLIVSAHLRPAPPGAGTRAYPAEVLQCCDGLFPFWTVRDDNGRTVIPLLIC